MKKKIIIISIFFISLLVFSEEIPDQTGKDEAEKVMTLDEAKMKYENEYPVFSQKGGMLRPDDHSFYFRTNDEWTGFSTFFIGYRYGVSDFFNISVEGGVSAVPHVYIAAVHLHFKIYESPGKVFFLGLRNRLGYRYQDTVMTSKEWQAVVGENYLDLQRNGIFYAADFTAAFRLGRLKRVVIYHTIYPRIDVDFVDLEYPVHVLFSPITTGFEVRLGKRLRWSFAFEMGYAFPIPWNGIPEEQWVNFPSLANIGVHYRFGNDLYGKYIKKKE